MKTVTLLNCFIVTLLLALFFVFPTTVQAIEDPLATPNNKIGIHVLFPAEIKEAAQLINSSGGDWGYVIVPIQSGDRDLTKWQQFMDDARIMHVIPIIRLATEGDYFNTKVWRKPTPADILDFANFLHSLQWPVKNRYIVVFNEVNRADEWGGVVDPTDYAQLLSYAVTTFKSKTQDFFMISAGLDNAAPNAPGYMDKLDYLRAMNLSVPGIFYQIDGLSSHAYPNPGFSQPPSRITSQSIASFRYETALLGELGSKKLPIFITETGWPRSVINDDTAASYYTQALTSVWNDPSIVAITPFLLRAGSPFHLFSFYLESGSPSQVYKTIKSYAKVKGAPTQLPLVLADKTAQRSLPIKNYTSQQPGVYEVVISENMRYALKWLLQLP